MSFPKRADHFLAWSKLMLQQAVVPDHPQYKSNKGGMSSRQLRRKRFRKRKRHNRKRKED